MGREFNGAAIVTYTFTWLMHIPYKFIRNAIYIIHTDNVSIFCIIDLITNAIQMVFELVFACIGLIVNGILGTIFHPIDTICGIPGGIVGICISLYSAVVNTFHACVTLFTGF